MFRTTHAFTPPDPAGDMLAFPAGDVILLHSTHPSGWLDGTSLSTGERGWVPENYCDPLDGPAIRPLVLAALVVFAYPTNTPRSAQVAVSTIVSGVRCLLTHASEAHAPESTKSRRALLVDVAALVASVKRGDDDLAELTSRVVCRAAAYYDESAVPNTTRSSHASSSGSECGTVTALARLNYLYETLLVSLAAFVESDPGSLHYPAKLLLTTRQSVHAAREFLALVETVAAHAAPVTYSLEEVRETTYMRVTLLVTAARDAATTADSQQLLLATTSVVRAAGLCLAKCKQVIDRVGDFELDLDRSFLESALYARVGITEVDEVASSPGPVLEPTSRTPLQDRILFNADGNVQGGSLEALVKQLTANDRTPDALFVSSFFLTFRLFTTPLALTQALIHRFSSLSPDEPNVLAARLRVYNAFKTWMESHWRRQTDNEILPFIIDFANGPLKARLPFAPQLLLDLSKRVVSTDKPLVPRAMSKLDIDTSLGILLPDSASVPTPIVNRQHLAIVARYVNQEGPALAILDFDPLELARQFTIKESRLFCQIAPEELLGQEFAKKKVGTAVNVKAMSALSTDLANLIGDTILAGNVMLKTRMNVIRHWIRVAEKCLELKNYNCLMAITCALQSSAILRLKKTWDLLPPRYHALFADLKSIIVYEKNYASYRTLLRTQSTPCIPYLGLYLTDLTFADEGNSDLRVFHPNTVDACAVINFDKHVRTTKIIADLQRFQVPYKLQDVPELQAWIDVEIARVHDLFVSDQHGLYRRSCAVEPKPNPVEPSILRNLRADQNEGGAI